MTSMPDYDGKVAVVTERGPGSDWRRCAQLPDAGALVVGGDLNEEALRAAAEGLGDGFTPVVGDVSNESDVEDLVATAVAQHDRVDAAFNVAGIGDLAPIVEMPEELWDRVMNVTLKGVFFSIKHEARAMIRRGARS